MRDTVYADTETTGLIDPHLPGGRRTWGAALLRYSPTAGRVVDAYWLQITDADLTHNDPAAIELNGFTDRFLPGAYGALAQAATVDGRTVWRYGATEAEAAEAIATITAGAVIAGSNPAFDMANFADILRRHGGEPGWYHHPRDVPNLAQGWLLGRGALLPYVDDEFLGHVIPADGEDWTEGTYSTRVLSEACGIPVPVDIHTELADALWMYDLDNVLTGRRKPVSSATVAG